MPLPELNPDEAKRSKACEEEFNKLLDRYGMEMIFERVERMGPAGQQMEMNIYFFPRRKVAVAAASG